ncbi:lysophospholipid acyltransferase family protein [Aureimonas ureilytica]|uniref:lysophospholipid acyltransferase family protein n=1 Tax=Aureimonas ureilytica TaxID=401562 RepID=UPI00035EF961|nr:lysophospholipid acyltransferase family protein [Aureimonas ureilytica]
MTEPEGPAAPAASAPETASGEARPKRRRWRVRVQRRLKAASRSPAAVRLVGRLIFEALRGLRASQREAEGSSDFRAILHARHPAIVALWHGQHLLAPFFRPRELPYLALLSRSADAEINAAVVERFGIETVRGSGGRVREAASEKGGVRALLRMKRALDEGFGICMIADVPKGTPREAGLGIVTLARLSGRPIVPSAAVTSRRRVLEKTWDKTTIPLPFGRIAVVMEEPIFVPSDAGAEELEAIRAQLTLAIERANRRAAELADRKTNH